MTSTSEQEPGRPAGQRSRIVTPTPPAPVPEARPRTAPRSDRDRSSLKSAPVPVPPSPGATGAVPGGAAEGGTGGAGGRAVSQKTSDGDVVRSTASMAVATLLSRITGFLRTVMIGSILGPPVASAFNIANTLPNLITEIVLGAVLTSLVVPVLVRAEKEDADHGAAFFRRLLTLAVSLLGTVTVLSVIGAPLLARMMMPEDSKVNVVMSTSFAYLVLPQIFFYGLFALFMAVLNTREVFRPGAWAPVVNNMITITVLCLYWVLPGRLDPLEPAGITDPHVLLLGLGMTLGVVVQALMMVPYLRREGIDMRPLWGIDARLKQFGGMAVAIVVYVAISQFGYVITTRIASVADAAAPVIYQNHWLLLQVPYGVIGVTLLTAIMPRLSRNAADGDDKAVVSDLTLGTKLTFIALIPIVVFFTVFGVPIANALFAYKDFDAETANILGWTLSFSAFTLIPYALVLLHLRVFYAREEAWTPTFIIAGITATKIVLSMAAPLVAASPERIVVLLGAANGFGFVTGAVIGIYLLRRKLGRLGMRSVITTSLWALGSALVGVAAAWVFGWLLNVTIGGVLVAMGSIGSLVFLAIVGVVFLIVTGLVLSRSGLPEVHNLGRAMARVPGMGRFIRPDVTISHDLGKASDQDLSTQLLSLDEFSSTPVPPPMSAGIVRGPRLVPGAPVSDGRFRLLADHGGVPGARFWRAREAATGREVALIFVDTSGNAPMAPKSAAAAAGIASEVKRRTKKLAALHSVAIAPNIQTEAYRNGCLIVADWVPGSSLTAVAEEGADPRAAAYALADLTDATAAAHAAGVPLGLDNKCRIRISTDGVAVLAFPVLLPESNFGRDATSIAAALEMLVDAGTAPSDVLSLQEDARRLAAEEDTEPAEYTALAASMRDAGLAKNEQNPAQLVVEKETAPRPATRPGFGGRSYSGKMMALIALTVFLLVSLVAALSAVLTTFLGGSNEESPLGSTSTSVETTVPTGPAVYLGISAINQWNDGSGAPVDGVEDGDRGTSWSTGGGEGLLIQLSKPSQISHVVVHTGEVETSGQVQVIAFTSQSPTSMNEGEQIGSIDVTGNRQNLDISDTENPLKDVNSVLVWVDELDDSETLDIADVDVVGW
nr:murein biosynthesis integral membrane protein MurJ [Corynebacterium pacaense]